MFHIKTLWFIGALVLCVTTSVTDRRILLSDPDYVAQQLNHLQSELQNLKVQVESQKHTIDAQQSAIISLQQISSNQQQTIDRQNQTLTYQQSAIQKISGEGVGVGTIYTRWGRKDCPVTNGSHIVYSGYVGGGYFNNSGDAANSLCMSDEPTTGQSTYTIYPSYIYGAEFQRGHEVFGLPQNDEDIACAVCRNSVHTISVMIPGRTQCYPGWVEAYSGLIVAGYPYHPTNTDHLCMDSLPQPIPGGQSNDEGQLFRPSVTKCGSLPCPPYEEDKLVPCVVCMM